MLDVNFHPFPILSSQRLLLREIADTDAPKLLQLRSDPAAMEFLDKAPMQNEAEALAWISRVQQEAAANNGITWAMTFKEDPSLLVGTIGLWRIIKEHYRAEIGYMLFPEYFNKGYMTEAIRLMNDFGFNRLKLHSIEANINPDNKASEAILLKTGYKKEAHFRENFFYNGVFKDSAVYSLLKNDAR